MKKAKRLLMWTVLNSLMCYGLYLYGVTGNEYAGNVIKFMTILGFVLWCSVAINKPLTEEMRKKGFPVSNGVNATYGLLYASALASFGMFFYAAMCIIESMLQCGIYYEKDES